VTFRKSNRYDTKKVKCSVCGKRHYCHTSKKHGALCILCFINVKVKLQSKQRERRVDNAHKVHGQTILDLMHSGLSVGEVCEKLNLETGTVAGVIVKNIGTIQFLRREVKA
jgi:hypothetical protein